MSTEEVRWSKKSQNLVNVVCERPLTQVKKLTNAGKSYDMNNQSLFAVLCKLCQRILDIDPKSGPKLQMVKHHH